MNITDLIYLTTLISLVICFVFLPARTAGYLKPLIAFLLVLSVVQLLVYGFYWHYLPAYLLLVLVTVAVFFAWGSLARIKRRILRISILVMLFAAVIPWCVLLPVPKLISPGGSYAVGTKVFRWMDRTRNEQITPEANDKRNVVVQAWYPTQPGHRGSTSQYLDGLGKLPQAVGPLPSWVFDHYDQVDTHGLLEAPLSKAKGRWPVIVFLTGNGASRAFYTSLLSGLASCGYVVLSIDHPYEAMVTQLADGRIATAIEQHPKGRPNLLGFMEGRLGTRIADVGFVLDQIGERQSATEEFFSSLDLDRIYITGHSLGGASAAAAMASDPRIRAAANIDGTLYGELPEPVGPRPFLLIESSKQGDHFQRYHDGNRKLFRQFGGGFRYELPGADHYSFTDAPLMLGYPVRLLMGRFQQFGQAPESTHEATIGILDAFFSGVPSNDFNGMRSVAAGYPDVVGRPVE